MASTARHPALQSNALAVVHPYLPESTLTDYDVTRAGDYRRLPRLLEQIQNADLPDEVRVEAARCAAVETRGSQEMKQSAITAGGIEVCTKVAQSGSADLSCAAMRLAATLLTLRSAVNEAETHGTAQMVAAKIQAGSETPDSVLLASAQLISALCSSVAGARLATAGGVAAAAVKFITWQKHAEEGRTLFYEEHRRAVDAPSSVWGPRTVLLIESLKKMTSASDDACAAVRAEPEVVAVLGQGAAVCKPHHAGLNDTLLIFRNLVACPSDATREGLKLVRDKGNGVDCACKWLAGPNSSAAAQLLVSLMEDLKVREQLLPQVRLVVDACLACGDAYAERMMKHALRSACSLVEIRRRVTALLCERVGDRLGTSDKVGAMLEEILDTGFGSIALHALAEHLENTTESASVQGALDVLRWILEKNPERCSNVSDASATLAVELAKRKSGEHAAAVKDIIAKCTADAQFTAIAG